MSKLIVANVHLVSEATQRIEKRSGQNTISFVATSNTFHIDSGGVSVPLGSANLRGAIVVSGNIIAQEAVTVAGKLVVSNRTNVSGALAITGTVYVDPTANVNTANLVVNSVPYLKDGAWERIATNVAVSAANTKFWNIPTDFKILRLTGAKVNCGTSDRWPQIKVSSDGGATGLSSGYVGYNWQSSTSQRANVRPWISSVISLESPFFSNGFGTQGAGGGHFELFFSSFGDAEKTKVWGTSIYANTSNSPNQQSLAGWHSNRTALNGLDVYFSSSGTHSGIFYLDGMRVPDSGNDQYTKILLHFDGQDASTTITDSAAGGSAHTWTAAGNGQIDTGIKKLGSTFNCDGTGDYTSTTWHADFDHGAGDWTIDCWFYVAGGAGATRRLFGTCDLGLTAQSLVTRSHLNTSNQMQVHTVGLSNTQYNIVGTSAPALSTWHHLAYVKTNNVLKMFINGTQEGGDLAMNEAVHIGEQLPFTVGRSGNLTSSTWNGSIDEFRLSVGIARWTADFTPPTRRYGP